TARTLSATQIVTLLGLSYVPFLLLSSVGVVVWFAALSAASSLSAYLGPGVEFQEWGRLFTAAVPYDLMAVENAFRAVFWGIGVLASCLILGYLILRVRGYEAGSMVQNGVVLLLYVAPVGLAIAGSLFIGSAFGFYGAHESLDGNHVLLVYQKSAKRFFGVL